jgi:hypothetical protein
MEFRVNSHTILSILEECAGKIKSVKNEKEAVKIITSFDMLVVT